MSSVVQATCPGCQKVLRIPAEYLQQDFRCKYCRTIIRARAASGGAKSQPPAAPRPTSRPAVPAPPPPPPPSPITASAPPTKPAPVPPPPPVAIQPPRPAAGLPVAPLAVTPALPVEPEGVFASFEQDGGAIIQPRTYRRNRRSRGSDWMGLILFVLFLGSGGGAVAFFWADIAPLFSSGPGQGSNITPKPNEPPGVTRTNGAFPRRGLVISVHNYLYANPIHFGDPNKGGRNFQSLLGRLSELKGFRIAPTQLAHLSDAAREPHPPVKSVIEKTIQDFLKNSRAQDRVLLLFAGHGVEIEGEAYLAPIEGELDKPNTLIPLKWLYEQLETCKARQKLLILDVARLNPSRGTERPAGGPVSAKFDEALKTPPAGVQVWSACIAGQQSYEFEDFKMNNGVFVDALYEAAAKGVEGIIQNPSDPFPVEALVPVVNKRMQEELGPQKLEQTARLTGSEAASGVTFDPDEAPAPKPTIARFDAGKGIAETRMVSSILKELNVPPIKKSQEEGVLRVEALPPFQAKVLDAYPVDKTPSELTKAIDRAQALLWALSATKAPSDLAASVDSIKKSGELKADLDGLRESFRAPSANGETAFKASLEQDGRQVASMIRLLEDEIENLKKAGEKRDEASRRVQANYDFILARIQNQLAYVYEYSSMLGQMRKEFPTRDPAVHGGWRLASRDRLQGDATGRKLNRDAQKLLDKMAKDHAGTPWEVLAKRERLTALGLEWKPEQ